MCVIDRYDNKLESKGISAVSIVACRELRGNLEHSAAVRQMSDITEMCLSSGSEGIDFPNCIQTDDLFSIVSGVHQPTRLHTNHALPPSPHDLLSCSSKSGFPATDPSICIRHFTAVPKLYLFPYSLQLSLNLIKRLGESLALPRVREHFCGT